MANRHFGNLADVFKHLALCEVLGSLRPVEYWESHAGAACYEEPGGVPAERWHGIHTFCRLLGGLDALRSSAYAGALGRNAGPAGDRPARIPGSPLLARRILGDNVRRFLFCDTDAESLQSIRDALPAGSAGPRELAPDVLECVQDDGVTVLRGAGMLLPEPWAGSTLAFLDPYDMAAPSEAGISPLDLACELANRAIPTLLFYCFADAGRRGVQRERLAQTLSKARLRGGRRFEGSLQAPADQVPTQWGFGLLALQLPAPALAAMDQKLAALEGLYEHVMFPPPQELASGAWRYASEAL